MDSSLIPVSCAHETGSSSVDQAATTGHAAVCTLCRDRAWMSLRLRGSWVAAGGACQEQTRHGLAVDPQLPAVLDLDSRCAHGWGYAGLRSFQRHPSECRQPCVGVGKGEEKRVSSMLVKVAVADLSRDNIDYDLRKLQVSFT